MEVRLHYLPEKPYFSCEVVVFHKNQFGDLYNVQNVTYSAKYGLFNCHDFYLGDEVVGMEEYGEEIVAWMYMDDLEIALLNELSKKCAKDEAKGDGDV